MSKPVLLTIDDDPDVLRPVSRNLRRKYGAEHRVLRADSGDSALEVLRELKQSPGTHPRRGSTPSSTTCSATGAQLTGPAASVDPGELPLVILPGGSA